jgi:GT2 family glycosyltransferase
MAAVVLNHRTLEDTCVAVSSLLASSRRPDIVIVVDNDVADECRARFAPQGTADRTRPIVRAISRLKPMC